MKKKLYTLLSDILQVPADKINDKTSPDNTASWDSFNGIMIATELEKSSGVKFTMADVISVKNVADIKEILSKYNIDYEC